MDWLLITISRDGEEIMPSVTVPPNVPSGLPMTTAVSPACSFDESPTVAADNSSSASILMTAISLAGSVPTSVALYCLLSYVVTVIEFASSTT